MNDRPHPVCHRPGHHARHDARRLLGDPGTVRLTVVALGVAAVLGIGTRFVPDGAAPSAIALSHFVAALGTVASETARPGTKPSSNPKCKARPGSS